MRKLLVGAIAVATVYFGFVYSSEKAPSQAAPSVPEDHELGV